MVPTVTQHDVAASPAFRPSYSGPKRAAARAQRHIMASSGAPRPLAGCGRHGITSHMPIAASKQPMDPLATRARASRTAAWKGSSSCAPEARARRETHRSSWLCERLRAEAATDGGEWCEGMVGPGSGLPRVPAVSLPSPFMTPLILLSRRRPSVSKAHGSWVSARGRDLLNISWWASSSLEPVVVDVVVDAILALARPCPGGSRPSRRVRWIDPRRDADVDGTRAPSDSRACFSLDDELFDFFRKRVLCTPLKRGPGFSSVSGCGILIRAPSQALFMLDVFV